VNDTKMEFKNLSLAYLQIKVPKSPSSLSTTDSDNIFITTSTNDVVTSINVVGAGIVMSTSCWSYLEIHVKPPIYCQKLLDLTPETTGSLLSDKGRKRTSWNLKQHLAFDDTLVTSKVRWVKRWGRIGRFYWRPCSFEQTLSRTMESIFALLE
jgi:hypothetical protein